MAIAISLCVIVLCEAIRFFSGRPEPKAQPAGAAMILHQPVFRVPLRLETLPVVDVMVNGQGPYKFVLDTGCDSILVSQDLAQRLHLPRTGGSVTAADAGGGGKIEYPCVTVRSLRLGEAEWVNFPASAHPNRAPLDEYDGVLGFSFFQRWLVTLDFPAKQITFETASQPLTDGNAIPPVSTTVTRPTISAVLNGVVTELLVDTGSSGCIYLPEANAEVLSFRSPPLEIPTVTAGGKHTTRIARLSGSAHVGGHVVEDPIISWFPGRKGSATIGMQILQHFALTFDSANGRVRFSRNDEGPIRVPGLRTFGLTLAIKKRETTAKILVGTVDPLTPAARLDIQVGDEVVSVDGKPVSEFADLKGPRYLQYLKDRSAITFELKRGDRRFTAEVPIVEQP